ncbi:hypothetical protein MCERE1_03395 [Burkholderiaceae bacterium]
MLRPSSATKMMPLLSISESMARMPVWAEMKLIALTAAMRESRGLSSTVLIIGVVKPLMFKVPRAWPVPLMAAPVMRVGLTVACTPVAGALALMAAALAIAEAIWLPLCGDTMSSASRDAPMGMPLMITSLAYICSRSGRSRRTVKPTTSPEAKAAGDPVRVN